MAAAPTVYDVATSGTFANQMQAAAFIVQQGDSLALLADAMEKMARPRLERLVAAALPPVDADATVAPLSSLYYSYLF